MAPKLSTCCGLSLKHGTIIIGILQSILSFMSMVLAAAYADNPHELIDMSDPSIVPDLSVLKGLLIVVAVYAGLQCTFAILLIFGAETNRPLLFLPWLFFQPILLTCYVITTLIAIVNHSAANNHLFAGVHFMLAAVVLAISSYKYIVVHSFYKHLKSLNF